MDYSAFYMINTIAVQFLHAVFSYTLYYIFLYTVMHPALYTLYWILLYTVSSYTRPFSHRM